jgi:hypothetical protein
MRNVSKGFPLLAAVLGCLIIGANPASAGDDDSSSSTPASTEPALTFPEGFVPRIDFAHVTWSALDQSQAEWQAQLDEAKRRVSSGRKKLGVGLSLVGAGLAVQLIGGRGCIQSGFVETDDCTGETVALYIAGGLAALAGGVTTAFGLVQYVNARDDVANLEARPPSPSSNPSGSPVAVLPLGDRQAISISVASRWTVGYRFNW